MSSLSQGERHRKDSRGFQEVGAKGENFKERVEVAKVYGHTSSQFSVRANGIEATSV